MISKVGVDAATIQEITVAADVGFGTFYSYFETKDQLASALLDCMIHDVGQRNADVTADITHTAPESLPAVRTKLMLRTGVNDPLWRWWALHPQMLFDRLDNGLGAYAKADIRSGIVAGKLSITEDDVDVAWRLALWAMVGNYDNYRTRAMINLGGGNVPCGLWVRWRTATASSATSARLRVIRATSSAGRCAAPLRSSPSPASNFTCAANTIAPSRTA